MFALHTHMHFNTALCFVLLYIAVIVDSIQTEEGLELLFRSRTQADWANVWHHEAHSRCRDKLVRQLFWACEKDIYRLTRRNRKRNELLSSNSAKELRPFWLSSDAAGTLLRTRRSGSHSITDECCTKSGCTWEEYAEYCPSNKRKNHY